MKCNFCGSENFVKTKFPLESFGEGGASVSHEVDVYLCLNCGHYEFFSKTKVTRFYETQTWISNTEKEIENLRCKLLELQNPTVTQNITDKIQQVEAKLKSIDITIRQQQTLKLKLSKLRTELKNMPCDIRKIEEKIRHLESELKIRRSNFENEYKKCNI